MSTEEVVRIPLIQLEQAVEAAFKTGLTPLIIDREGKASTFYSYQGDATILEAKQIVLKGMAVEKPDIEVLEPFRKCLAGSMKYGRNLVVNLRNSAPALYSKWNDEALDHDNTRRGTAYFPRTTLFRGGRGLKEDEEWAFRIFREEDMHPNKNFAFCR